MLAQPNRRDAMGARQAKCCLGVNAEEIRGFDGREKWLPGPFDLFIVILCLFHSVSVSFEELRCVLISLLLLDARLIVRGHIEQLVFTQLLYSRSTYRSQALGTQSTSSESASVRSSSQP